MLLKAFGETFIVWTGETMPSLSDGEEEIMYWRSWLCMVHAWVTPWKQALGRARPPAFSCWPCSFSFHAGGLITKA